MEEAPNLSYVVEIAGDDHDFKQQFIKRFKEEFLWEVGMYLRFMKKKEPRAAAEIVAKSKYKFSILGLRKAYSLANAHEERLRIDDERMHHDFGKVLKKVCAFLEGIDTAH